jgi:hypothetical protein
VEGSFRQFSFVNAQVSRFQAVKLFRITQERGIAFVPDGLNNRCDNRFRFMVAECAAEIGLLRLANGNDPDHLK